MKTRLRQALTSGRLVLTAECLPPRNGGASRLLKNDASPPGRDGHAREKDAGSVNSSAICATEDTLSSRPVRSGGQGFVLRQPSKAVRELSALLPAALDAVMVADNPDGIYGSALACAALLAGEGRETVVSMTTRDRNRIALESDALGASLLGVGAVLCLSGNHQSLGLCPQAAGVGDMDSIQLTQALKALDIPELLIGAVAHPYLQPLELNLLRLRKKIAAGADFLLTQPVFDLPGFTRWLDAVREAGLDERTAIMASVLPLTSLERAESLQRQQTYGPLGEAVIARLKNASDPAKEGLALAAEVAAQLKAVPGLRGIHILSGGCEAVAGQVIDAAGLA